MLQVVKDEVAVEAEDEEEEEEDAVDSKRNQSPLLKNLIANSIHT